MASVVAIEASFAHFPIQYYYYWVNAKLSTGCSGTGAGILLAPRNWIYPPGTFIVPGSIFLFLGIEIVHRICEINLVSQDQKIPP